VGGSSVAGRHVRGLLRVMLGQRVGGPVQVTWAVQNRPVVVEVVIQMVAAPAVSAMTPAASVSAMAPAISTMTPAAITSAPLVAPSLAVTALVTLVALGLVHRHVVLLILIAVLLHILVLLVLGSAAISGPVG